jgi:hypothetical protein
VPELLEPNDHRLSIGRFMAKHTACVGEECTTCGGMGFFRQRLIALKRTRDPVKDLRLSNVRESEFRSLSGKGYQFDVVLREIESEQQQRVFKAWHSLASDCDTGASMFLALWNSRMIPNSLNALLDYQASCKMSDAEFREQIQRERDSFGFPDLSDARKLWPRVVEAY